MKMDECVETLLVLVRECMCLVYDAWSHGYVDFPINTTGVHYETGLFHDEYITIILRNSNYRYWGSSHSAVEIILFLLLA